MSGSQARKNEEIPRGETLILHHSCVTGVHEQSLDLRLISGRDTIFHTLIVRLKVSHSFIQSLVLANIVSSLFFFFFKSSIKYFSSVFV